jgi:glycosyltransferase involved in cell wall biosynthesis
MYVKREFLDYVGILDDDFQFAFEDVDWCLSGWEAGYRTLYFPAATLTHVESATRPKNKSISEKEKQSIDYFWEKWGAWFDKRNVKNPKGQTRIIFVLQTLGLSGGIKIVFEHANRLAERGFACEIWALDAHGSAWEKHENVQMRSFKNYERLIIALEKEEAIKVATWWETAFPVWLASVRKGIPVYFIQEFETWFYPDDPISQAAVVACYRKEFKNMTTSQYNLGEIESLGLKATAIPCGYDDKTYKQLKDVKREANVVVALGRRFFQKNFPMTLKGWQGLGEQRPPLWLFGVEPDMAKLDAKIKYITKPSNEAVNNLYNQATIFVQTSRHEGFSLPILEAMAGGAPVICTDAHGNRDFCEDGKNCLIVGQDDDAALTKAFRRLLKDKKLRDKLSASAVKTARNYRWDVIADKIEVFYKNVARQR